MTAGAFPFDAQNVVAFHEACLDSGKWPGEEAPAHPPGDAWPWVEANHAFNARLWKEEDLVRRPGAADAAVASAKRAIDGFNQQRNDAIERLDDALHAALAARMDAGAPTPPPSRGCAGRGSTGGRRSCRASRN